MTDQNYQDNDNEAIPPIIPPMYLLVGSALSFLLALVLLLATTSFGVLGWSALGIGVLLLVLVVVLAPQQAANFLSGRSFRFGSVSVVTSLFVVAVLITVYWFIDTQNWTVDITQTDQYTLSAEGIGVIERLGNDPTVPPIEIIGFFNNTAVARQEQIEILLEDYAEASGGKISYEFVNPDVNVRRAQQYGAANGSLVIINTARPSPEVAQTVNASFELDQNQLTNRIISVTSTGQFNIYFLDVQDGVDVNDSSEIGAADIVAVLEQILAWDVQQVTFSQLTAEDSEIELNQPDVDGEILIIPGGSRQLSASEVTFITDYLDNGGHVIITAMPDLNDPALASTPALNTYLAENFGISYGSDVILDPRNSVGGQANVLLVSDLTRTPTIINSQVPEFQLNANSLLVMGSARPITVAEEAPAGVETYTLARTSQDAYGKSYEELLAEDYNVNDEDVQGQLPVIAAAQNAETGARVVLFGSSDVLVNSYLQTGQGIVNPFTFFNSLLWSMDVLEYYEGQEPLLPDFDVRPADTPVFATTDQLRLINFISLFALPFGVLIIGAVVWVNRRSGSASEYKPSSS